MTSPANSLKLRRFDVVDKREGYVTVAIPDATPLEIRCAPQFSPDIGGTVLVTFVGPVPQVVVAESIAVDAITAREIEAGSISALLIDGDVIQTDADGARVVIDEDGLRLYNDADDVVVNLDTATGSALVTGTYRSALDGLRFEVVNGAITLHGTSDAVGSIYMDGDDSLILNHDSAVSINGPYFNSATAYSALSVRLQVQESVGLHFNGAPPIAPPTLPAAATDAASTQTLANAIRQALIDYGLAV